MAALGLRCCVQAFSSCGERGLLFVAVCGLLITVASLVVEHGPQARRLQQLWHVGSVVVARGLQSTGSVVVAHGLSCSVACGIFPDQGSNLCPLHWQADSQPLHHQGSPYFSQFRITRFQVNFQGFFLVISKFPTMNINHFMIKRSLNKPKMLGKYQIPFNSLKPILQCYSKEITINHLIVINVPI